MKLVKKWIFILGVLAALAAGGVIWLGNARLAPPVQTIRQAIPDDRIAH